MSHPWLAQRTAQFDSSGIRKVFDLAAKMTDPINLSIGQPDFDVPPEVRQAAIDAIESKKNGYALTQGIRGLREKLQERVDRQYGHDDREVAEPRRAEGEVPLLKDQRAILEEELEERVDDGQSGGDVGGRRGARAGAPVP